MRAFVASRRFQIWLVSALTINALGFYVPHGSFPPQVKWGVSFDVAITVPLLYFLLVLRSRRQSAATMVPLCLLALLRAAFVAPGMAAIRPAIAAAADLGITGFIVLRARKGWQQGSSESDIVDRLRAAALEVVRLPRAAAAVATEIAIVWYALCSWRARPEYPNGSHAISVHERSGAGLVFAALAVLSVPEAIVAHVLLTRWSPRAAWVLSGLGVYGTLFLLAMSRSFRLRPGWVRNGELVLRNGLLWTLRAPISQIASVSRTEQPADVSMPPATSPNFWLNFASPVSVRKFYGFERRVQSVAVSVDDPRALTAALLV